MPKIDFISLLLIIATNIIGHCLVRCESEELLREVIINDRVRRKAGSAATEAFVDFEFIKEPEDVPSAAKDSSVRFDCLARLGDRRIDGRVRDVKIQWRKDGGALDVAGRNGVGGRISILQNGSLLIKQLGSAADADDGFYQCAAVVDDQWTFVSRKAKLALASLSRFEDQPDDRNVLAGETVFLPCRLHSNPPAIISWYRDNVELTTGVGDNKRFTIVPKTGSLEIRNVQTQDQGSYKCKAQNGDKHRYSKEGRIRVAKNELLAELNEPKFEVQPRGQSLRTDDRLVLECAANGHPEPEIRWFKDQKQVDFNAKNDRRKRIGQGTLVVDNLQATDAGVYVCRVNNSEDSLDATAVVEIQESPVFTTKPKSVVLKETADAEFECQAVGKPAPSISWYKNGELVTASEYFMIEGTRMKILGLVKSDQGIYQCIADNEAGSSETAAQLVVEMAETAQTEGSGGEVPTEPLGLKAVKVSSRTVTIRWDTPLQSRGDLRGYSVYYKQNGSDRERLVNVSASGPRELQISRLQPSSTYFFRILASNNNGAGLSSAPLKITTSSEQGIPGVVRNFRGTPLSSTSIELRWDPPNGDETLGYYRIFYSMNDDSVISTVSTSEEDEDEPEEDDDETEIQVQTTTYTLHGLEEYTNYRFRVEAVNSNGVGPSTEVVIVRTDSDVPSAPPRNVTLASVTMDSVVVQWAPPPERHQNGEITGYKIRYKHRDRSTRGNIVNVESREQQFVITGLDSGAAYLVRVAASTIKGLGPYSAWVTTETPLRSSIMESQVPGPPTSLRVVARSNELLLYWTPPVESGVTIRGYLIGWGVNIPDVQLERVEPTERFFRIHDLSPSSEYVISLKAYNKLGNGFPIYETVRTSNGSTPVPKQYIEPPMSLRAIGKSSSSIEISWTWSDPSIPSHSHVIFNVKYNPAGLNAKPKYLNVTDMSVIIKGLRPDQQYEFAIKAVVDGFESPWSMTTSTKTLSAPPGSTPRDLTLILSPDSPNSVIVNWQPPRQPNGRITQYLIYYTDNPDLPDSQWNLEQIRGDKLTTLIKNLRIDREYYFKIQAFNERGYSKISAVKSYQFRPPVSSYRSAGIQHNDDGGPKPNQYSHTDVSIIDQLPNVNVNIPNGKTAENTATGVSKHTVIIIIASVALVLVAIVIIGAVYMCRQRYRTRSGYAAGKKVGNSQVPTMLGADAKPPPDLWIHHDHSLELRNVGERNSSTQDFKRRSPSPPPDMTDPPRYHSLATMPTSSGTLSRSYHHQSSNSVDVPRPCPAKAPPPQVVYTGPKMISPRDGSSSPYGSAGTVGGVLTPTPPPQVVVKPLLDQTARPGTQSSNYSGNPLKSFTALASPPPPPPPLGHVTPRTHLIRPMINHTQSPKAKPAGIVIGTKARVMQARPTHMTETTYSTCKEADELPRSYSTEELNAQMQNLDSLMKDLNAISASEFDV